MKSENPFSFTAADIILDGNWLDLCQRFMKEMRSSVPVNGYDYCDPNQIDLSPGSLRRLMKSYERFLYMATKYPPSEGYAFVHPTYAVRFDSFSLQQNTGCHLDRYHLALSYARTVEVRSGLHTSGRILD